MSNRNELSIVVAQSFELADRIIANSFDYGDGSLQRKRTAIAMNAIARATEGLTLKDMWTNGMMDDSGKANTINGFKNLPAHDADDAVRPIWDHMTDEHKKMHLENHPESGFHVTHEHAERAADVAAEAEVEEHQEHEENHQELRERHKRRNRNKRVKERDAGTEDDDDEWWNKMSMTEQKEYLRKHPKSKKARRWRVGIRNMSKKAMGAIHREVRHMGNTYRQGMGGLRNLRNGKKMTEEQKDALKKVAKRMAKILMLSLGTAAMFTPLSGFAMELGDKYADGFKDRSKELESDHEKRRFRKVDGVEVDEDGNPKQPTTVGQTNGNGNGGGGGSSSDTTVGQTAQTSQSGVNLKMGRSKHHEQNQKDETELDWMRRDMTEWLMQQDPEKLAKEFKSKRK